MNRTGIISALFSIVLSSHEGVVVRVWSFQTPKLMSSVQQRSIIRTTNNSDFTLYAQEMSVDELKVELTAYLKKREEANADELAKE